MSLLELKALRVITMIKMGEKAKKRNTSTSSSICKQPPPKNPKTGQKLILKSDAKGHHLQKRIENPFQDVTIRILRHRYLLHL